MPNSKMPPGSDWPSKIVTAKFILARSPATVRPAGPLPITATLPRLPVEGGSGFKLFSWAKSAMNISKLPISMPCLFLAKTQCASHWRSCGHTLPQMAGRLLRSEIIS